MSWYYEGVSYHSRAEYEAAMRAGELSRARSEANSLRSELQTNLRRVRETERELQAANVEVQQQRALHDRLSMQVNDLNRTQQRLNAAQDAMREQIREGFAEVEHEMEGLEEAQRKLEEDVMHEFDEVRGEVAEGLQQAEKRRADTERQLQAAVNAVDEKFEADRRKRLQTAENDLARADMSLDMAAAALTERPIDANALDLESDLVKVRSYITTGRQLHREGKPEAALAEAERAHAEARHLVYEADRRAARMTNTRKWLTEHLEDLDKDLNDEVVQHYFQGECQRARDLIETMRSRSTNGYQRYDRFSVESDRDERILKRLEEDVKHMTARAPVVREQYRNREKRVGECLETLFEVCGALTEDPKASFADPNDRTSDRIVDCSFSSGKVRLRFPLDEKKPFSMDGYGHSGNHECSSIMQQLMQRMNEQSMAGRSEFDPGLPQAPRTPVGAAAPTAGESINNRLERLQREIL
jgi:chromosome segregation ATPase